MASRRRVRPTDPLAAARRRAAERAAARDPGQWGLDRAALDLKANADVVLVAEGGRPPRARRQDVFEVFRSRGKMAAGSVEAVRRLQSDLAVLHRAAGGVAVYAERIDQSPAIDGGCEKRMRTARRIQAVLALAGPASGRLLLAILEAEPVGGRQADWRSAVARVTGERLADAQGAVLRAACENLAGAYSIFDRGRRVASA